ncbi:MAG: hypothetical protein CFH34_00722 [Alphaproteobacteria bacterium MarineAlpha9_Bin4]|nr:hypothetical protein [Pelagibacterales bacterium]PPR26807.1 MAG: hypothetical protein CFH34_00722 [Alphaproteobacteria bacterium MarineAlpha9_Bin4]
MIDFIIAFGLVFVIEGLLLFISPNRIKNLLNVISSYSEKKIRLIGLLSIIIGIIIIALIRL